MLDIHFGATILSVTYKIITWESLSTRTIKTFPRIWIKINMDTTSVYSVRSSPNSCICMDNTKLECWRLIYFNSRDTSHPRRTKIVNIIGIERSYNIIYQDLATDWKTRLHSKEIDKTIKNFPRNVEYNLYRCIECSQYDVINANCICRDKTRLECWKLT